MSEEIRIEVELPDGDTVKTFITRILDTFEGELITALKDNTPVDKGYLREHWHEERSGHRIEFFNDTFYGPLLLRGTGLYGPYKTPICASGYRLRGTYAGVDRPKALHWFNKSGTEFFRTCVKGIKPRDFVGAGITEGVKNALEALQ